MSLINEFTKAEYVTRSDVITFIKLLSPFAPHLCEEMWEILGENPDGKTFCTLSQWPEYDEEKAKDDVISMGVQVNGKVRGNVDLPQECTKEEALAAAKANPNVYMFLNAIA